MRDIIIIIIPYGEVVIVYHINLSHKRGTRKEKKTVPLLHRRAKPHTRARKEHTHSFHLTSISSHRGPIYTKKLVPIIHGLRWSYPEYTYRYERHAGPTIRLRHLEVRLSSAPCQVCGSSRRPSTSATTVRYEYPMPVPSHLPMRSGVSFSQPMPCNNLHSAIRVNPCPSLPFPPLNRSRSSHLSTRDDPKPFGYLSFDPNPYRASCGSDQCLPRS